jgi:Protein of unknown function (DUF3800)
MKCYVYIDESGDLGIKTVRGDGKLGATPYFVLAAAVMPRAATLAAKTLLQEVEATIPKQWKHATDLNHMQTVYFCRRAAALNVRFFAVISNKATLNEYADEINWDPHKFYNKCSHYLLECVGKYMAINGFTSEYPDVVFEERNHNFDTLIRYTQTIKDNPFHTHASYIKHFNPFAFVTRGKNEEPLLKFADLAAHSVYQCVNKIEKNFHITEPRYLDEISKRFGCDEKGTVLGTGIKCIHTLDDLKLDPEIHSFFQKLRATPRKAIGLQEKKDV